MTTTSIGGTASRPAVPAQSSRYDRPALPRLARPAARRVGHETDQGCCSVCGAAWPCARARREQRLAADPSAANLSARS